MLLQLYSPGDTAAANAERRADLARRFARLQERCQACPVQLPCLSHLDSAAALVSSAGMRLGGLVDRLPRSGHPCG